MSESEKFEDEGAFFSKAEAKYDEKVPDFSKTLNIAVIGTVSSGKSSLINALLGCTRDNVVAPVAAPSGRTVELRVFQLDSRVLLVDSPGLDDVRANNSEVTTKFLEHIDVGILVVTGSADASQRKHLIDMRQHAKRVFVVLNKIDAWDSLKSSGVDAVVAQWTQALEIPRLYTTCTNGYDPETRLDVPLDIRGVDELRTAVETFLAEEGKDLLLARVMVDKRKYAISIVAAALAAVAGEAFVPGSAIYITATQAAAITSLFYLYTGRILSKSSALNLLPAFVGKSIGRSIFLWVKSFLPPTIILDVAAAGVAVSVTLAMLATVARLLEAGAQDLIAADAARQFSKIDARARALPMARMVKSGDQSSWRTVVSDFIFKSDG